MDFILGNRLRKLPGPVLVTGHTGFKGAWLTFLLERLGVPVVGYSLAPEPESLYARAKRVGVIPEVYADIRNIDEVEVFLAKYRPSAIIHMAAQPLVLESYKTPRDTFNTNVMGTVNVLDAAFKTNSVEAIIVVTTDKVYRNENIGRVFIETDALAGKDPYSASKVGAESAVAAWQRISEISNGPKVIAVRAGNVIGGGDWAEDRLLPDLVRGFSTHSPIKLRNATSTRPWQHVLDPLLGYLMALESVLAGNKITSMNFGPSGESISVSRVAEISKGSWPDPVSIGFIEKLEQEGLEAIVLQLNSNLAKKSLNWSCAWNQHDSVVATIEWWDKVLNKSISPVIACDSDIGFILERAHRLDIA
jgi:CDP-glucose 4,6-dehydratase